MRGAWTALCLFLTTPPPLRGPTAALGAPTHRTASSTTAGSSMPADNSHPSEATLISWAQNVVRHDMGLKDEDLLDEAFYFIGPFDGCVRTSTVCVCVCVCVCVRVCVCVCGACRPLRVHTCVSSSRTVVIHTRHRPCINPCIYH
jgi:hypothetical protein